MDVEQPDGELIKCVVVGDTAVGKTRLICARACNSRLHLSQLMQTHIPTVWAIDQYRMHKEVLERSCGVVDGVNVSLRLWDTFGDHEKDRRFAYGRSDVVLLCFSIANPTSLRNCKLVWLPEIRKFCPNTPIVLVGCKNDLRYMYRDEQFLSLCRDRSPFYRPLRECDLLTPEQGRSVARDINAPYFESSVLTHFGVSEVFENVIREALTARRSQRFWITNLRNVKRPMLQRPFCPPKPSPPMATVPKTTFDEDIHPLLTNSSIPDAAIRLNGQIVFYVHRIILASASSVFKKLFTLDQSLIVETQHNDNIHHSNVSNESNVSLCTSSDRECDNELTRDKRVNSSRGQCSFNDISYDDVIHSTVPSVIAPSNQSDQLSHCNNQPSNEASPSDDAPSSVVRVDESTNNQSIDDSCVQSDCSSVSLETKSSEISTDSIDATQQAVKPSMDETCPPDVTHEAVRSGEDSPSMQCLIQVNNVDEREATDLPLNALNCDAISDVKCAINSSSSKLPGINNSTECKETKSPSNTLRSNASYKPSRFFNQPLFQLIRSTSDSSISSSVELLREKDALSFSSAGSTSNSNSCLPSNDNQSVFHVTNGSLATRVSSQLIKRESNYTHDGQSDDLAVQPRGITGNQSSPLIEKHITSDRCSNITSPSVDHGLSAVKLSTIKNVATAIISSATSSCIPRSTTTFIKGNNHVTCCYCSGHDVLSDTENVPNNNSSFDVHHDKTCHCICNSNRTDCVANEKSIHHGHRMRSNSWQTLPSFLKYSPSFVQMMEKLAAKINSPHQDAGQKQSDETTKATYDNETILQDKQYPMQSFTCKLNHAIFDQISLEKSPIYDDCHARHFFTLDDCYTGDEIDDGTDASDDLLITRKHCTGRSSKNNYSVSCFGKKLAFNASGNHISTRSSAGCNVLKSLNNHCHYSNYTTFTHDNHLITVLDVKCDTVSLNAFEQVMNFIYTGTYPDSKVHSTLMQSKEVLYLAEVLDIKQLSNSIRATFSQSRELVMSRGKDVTDNLTESLCNSSPMGNFAHLSLTRQLIVDGASVSSGYGSSDPINYNSSLLSLSQVEQPSSFSSSICLFEFCDTSRLDFLTHLKGNLIDLTLNHSVFHDVTFILDDNSLVNCHRCILSARCEMMRAMFRGDFIESYSKLIKFPGVSKCTFHQLLYYFYTDTVKCDVKPYNCIKLLELANRLCLPRLLCLVEDKIIQDLTALAEESTDCTAETCLTLLEACQMHNCDQLANFCLHYLSVNYKDVSQRQGKILRSLHPENQAYLNRNRWPPVWFQKEEEYYDRCIREREWNEKCKGKGLKRHRINSVCLCFSTKSRRRNREGRKER